MNFCLRRDADEDYEKTRALVSRGTPGIERKWFTVRILISLFSVVICLVAPGVGLYKYPSRLPHVVWAGLFLALFVFLINIGIGALINRRVKTLILAEYEARYTVPRALLDDEEYEDVPLGISEGESSTSTTEEPESGTGSLNVMDAIMGGMKVALEVASPTIAQGIRVVDDKPIGDRSRVEDRDNSYDPKYRSKLADRQVAPEST